MTIIATIALESISVFGQLGTTQSSGTLATQSTTIQNSVFSTILGLARSYQTTITMKEETGGGITFWKSIDASCNANLQTSVASLKQKYLSGQILLTKTGDNLRPFGPGVMAKTVSAIWVDDVLVYDGP